MFNNLFDSFQSTVVQAKKDRDQLDRLLTVSTPKERLLVAVTTVVVIFFVGWLWFGHVPYSLAVDGVLIETGDSASEEPRSMQAIIWVGSEDEPVLAAGSSLMPAGIPAALVVELADGNATAFDGKISELSALTPAGELAAVASHAPISVYRIAITLEEIPDLSGLDTKACEIIIQLGRQSLMALLDMQLN